MGLGSRAGFAVRHAQSENGPQHTGRRGCDQNQPEIWLESAERVYWNAEQHRHQAEEDPRHCERRDQREPQAKQAERARLLHAYRSTMAPGPGVV